MGNWFPALLWALTGIVCISIAGLICGALAGLAQVFLEVPEELCQIVAIAGTAYFGIQGAVKIGEWVFRPRSRG